MHDLLDFLESRDRRWIWLGTLVSAFALGYYNSSVGWEVSLSILYLIPTGIAAWVLGRGPGVMMAVISAVLWWIANRNFPVSNEVFLHWNAFVRFLFFLIVSELLVGLKGALARERKLERTDSLTGLANSRAFTEIAEREIARARRTSRPLALACMDLDGFKQVNDELGHTAGDELLSLVGASLRGSTRSSDLAARLGGDEFAILLPETDQEGTEIILSKVVDKIRTYAVVQGRSAGVSAGAIVFAQSPPDLDMMLKAADELMYEVKRSGKANVIVRTVESRYGVGKQSDSE